MKVSLICLAIFVIFQGSLSVDHGNFKTCEQSSFCKRCRNVKSGQSQYAIVPGTLNSYSDSITLDLVNKENNHKFDLKLTGLASGNNFRLEIDEKQPLSPRYRVTDSLKETPQSGQIKVTDSNEKLTVSIGSNKAVFHSDPFRIDFFNNEILVTSVNAKGLMRFEELRAKPKPVPENPENPEEEQQASVEEEPGNWEENFKSHHDSKPKGPEAVALDFSFPEADILFGIPEHADTFALKTTNGKGDPYR